MTHAHVVAVRSLKSVVYIDNMFLIKHTSRILNDITFLFFKNVNRIYAKLGIKWGGVNQYFNQMNEEFRI